MGVNFGDFDNDGWFDFYLVIGDVFYVEICFNVMFVYRLGYGFVNVIMVGGFGYL